MKNDVKIIDFGLARKKDSVNLHSIVGTPLYVAPEVLDGKYDRKCDIWALGVLLFLMLTGNYPFQDDNRANLFDKIKYLNPHIDKRFKISKEACDLVNLLLTKDPHRRPEAKKVLEHSWFDKNLKDQFTKNSINALKLIPTLEGFKVPSPFMKRVLKILIEEIDIPEVEAIRQNFYIMDRKKNGIVDITKFKSDLRETDMNINKIEKTSRSIRDKKEKITNNSSVFSNDVFDRLTIDKRDYDKINYTSFLAANCHEHNLITDQMITEVFKRFDVDNCGFITISGFHKAIRRTGKKISLSESKEMLVEAGFANPDQITIEDFTSVIKDFLKPKESPREIK